MQPLQRKSSSISPQNNSVDSAGIQSLGILLNEVTTNDIFNIMGTEVPNNSFYAKLAHFLYRSNRYLGSLQFTLNKSFAPHLVVSFGNRTIGVFPCTIEDIDVIIYPLFPKISSTGTSTCEDIAVELKQGGPGLCVAELEFVQITSGKLNSFRRSTTETYVVLKINYKSRVAYIGSAISENSNDENHIPLNSSKAFVADGKGRMLLNNGTAVFIGTFQKGNCLNGTLLMPGGNVRAKYEEGKLSLSGKFGTDHDSKEMEICNVEILENNKFSGDMKLDNGSFRGTFENGTKCNIVEGAMTVNSVGEREGFTFKGTFSGGLPESGTVTYKGRTFTGTVNIEYLPVMGKMTHYPGGEISRIICKFDREELLVDATIYYIDGRVFMGEVTERSLLPAEGKLIVKSVDEREEFTFEGKFLDGLPQSGKITRNNNGSVFTGTVTTKLRPLKGTIRYTDGKTSSISCEFAETGLLTKVTIRYNDRVFEGNITEDFLPTEGEMTLQTLDWRGRFTFKGKFLRGEPQSGKITYDNGSIFDGDVTAGYVPVRGTMTIKTACGREWLKFEGTFLGGEPKNGKITYNNGDTFEGEVTANFSPFSGTMIVQAMAEREGFQFEGTFLEGTPKNGRIIYDDGSIFDGVVTARYVPVLGIISCFDNVNAIKTSEGKINAMRFKRDTTLDGTLSLTAEFIVVHGSIKLKETKATIKGDGFKPHDVLSTITEEQK